MTIVNKKTGFTVIILRKEGDKVSIDGIRFTPQSALFYRNLVKEGGAKLSSRYSKQRVLNLNLVPGQATSVK